MFSIVDVETTGSNRWEERITEIAILIHNGSRVIEQYTTLVNPQRPIDPFVVALTGITDEMVVSAPLFEDIKDHIRTLTDKTIFVGHNVRFDYGMFRKEFGRVGEKYQRKQICTVRLSKKIFPELPSYGLGKICRHLEIPVDNRHRAYGDAAATAVLFEKLIFNDRREILHSMLAEGLDENLLPPNIKKTQVKDLPEETGVYYFKDQNDKILYVGKSKNIRNRVISHFSSDLKSDRHLELKNRMHHISFQQTGSELIAMLLESDEIKRFMPEFNRAQRRRKYRFGVFIRHDENEMIDLSIESLKLDEEPVFKSTTRKSAERIIERLDQKHQFSVYKMMYQQVSGIQDKLNGIKEIYNQKVTEALTAYHFKHPNFFLLETGIEPWQKSVIWVENGIYQGFGFFDPNVMDESIEALKNCVDFYYDNPDVRSIIRSWLRKKKKRRLITY